MKYGVRFRSNSLEIFNGIVDYEAFTNRIIEIRKVFQFNNKFNIVVIEDLQELSDILQIPIPEWVIGTNIADTIIILNYHKWKHTNNEKVENLILHEFTHVVLNFKAKNNLPIWLNEGLAIYFARQEYAPKRYVDPNLDFYTVDYSTDGIYNLAATIINKLIEVYGIASVINEALNCECFEENWMFNNKNLKRLLYQGGENNR